MPNKNYIRGRDSEYKAVRELESEGYHAYRTAGSHGCADVIAWNEWCLRLIQIKTFQIKEGDYQKDITCLRTMKLPPSTRCEIWTRKTGQTGWTRQDLVSTTFM